MSDELRQRGRRLIADVVKDVKARTGDLKKIRQMMKLAKEVDPEFDTEDIEAMLDVSETVADDILKRLDKPEKK